MTQKLKTACLEHYVEVGNVRSQERLIKWDKRQEECKSIFRSIQMIFVRCVSSQLVLGTSVCVWKRVFCTVKQHKKCILRLQNVTINGEVNGKRHVSF